MVFSYVLRSGTISRFRLLCRRPTSIRLISSHGGKKGHIKHRSLSDQQLLAEIIEEVKSGKKMEKDMGPEHWRKQFDSSLLEVEKGLNTKLEDRFKTELPKIESYNKDNKVDVLHRMKINPEDPRLDWSSFVNNESLLKAIAAYLQSSKPTDFQKRLLSLMTGHLSTIAKGDQGSGRSTALIVSMMNLSRNPFRGEGINSLILVKTTDLVLQYKRIIGKILGNNHDYDIAQFLHRSSVDEESKQQEILGDHPTPRILVATLQRLLDLLATRGMDYLKINNLSALCVDDFDFMVDEIEYLSGARKAPIVQLLDYVIKLQDYKRSHNERHLQVIFTVSNTCKDTLIEQVKSETKWFDWSRYISLGTYESSTDIPSRNSIASNVGIASVLVEPYISEKNKKKFKVKLSDMIPFDYGTELTTWLDKLYRSPRGTDYAYKKARNVKRSRMSKEVRDMALQIIVSGFLKLSKKKGCEPLRNEKILMVYPDEVSGQKVMKLLTKSKKSVKLYNPAEDATFFSDEENPNQILLANSSVLLGITFRGLKNVVLLGMDSIKDSREFVTIAGRLRGDSSTGLLSENLFPSFGDSNKDTEIQSRIYLLNSKMDFEYMERNFLERLLIKSGLVKQFSPLGSQETDFNKIEYERLFATDYTIADNS